MSTPASTRRTTQGTHAARLVSSLRRPDVDLRGLLDPTVGDQGPRPLCLAFAISGSHEAARSLAASPPRPLAPEAIWWRCTQQGQTGSDGTLLTHATTALAETGQPFLTSWPYDQRLGPLSQPPPAAAGTPPWFTGTVRILHLAQDGIEDGVENALAMSLPVVLILELTDEFSEPEDDGHVELPNIRAAAGGYHAVLCVGVATDPQRGRRLLIRNSWSKYWGLGGYCWLPMAYLVGFAAPEAVVIEHGPS